MSNTERKRGYDVKHGIWYVPFDVERLETGHAKLVAAVKYALRELHKGDVEHAQRTLQHAIGVSNE